METEVLEAPMEVLSAAPVSAPENGKIAKPVDFFVQVVGDIPNRAVISKCFIKAGSRLMFEFAPDAGYCLDIDKWPNFCNYCLVQRPSTETKAKRCTRCRQVYYCDQHCQSKHWPTHKTECKFIADLLETEGHEDPGFLRDILLIRRAINNDTLKGVLGDMCDVELPVAAFVFKAIADHFRKIREFKDVPAEQILTILRRFQANSFTLLGEFNSQLGHGVFPFSSLVNHSCEPNLAATHIYISGQKPVQTFAALRDIHPGEELTHSYVDQLQPTSMRQEQLNSRYGFNCRCRRCLSPLPVDLNYLQFSPEILNLTSDGEDISLPELVVELDRLENILQGKAHWSLRHRQFQLFSICFFKHRYQSALRLLNKVLTYDRLILSENHPSFILHERYKDHLERELKKARKATIPSSK